MLLSGITVLDISRLLPGGFASLLLRRAGARVIKVEQPGVGDYYRALTGGREFVDLGHFREIHAGKEFLTLNLRAAAGREVFRRLIKRSDVLIENFRPGTLARLGLSFSELARWNRRLILCSITGAGQKGQRLAGHDLNYLAASGLLSLSRDKNRQPVIPDFQIVDLAAGYRAAFLLLAALLERHRTDRGVWVDVSMLETGKEMARLYRAARERTSDKVLSLLEIPNYQVYETKNRRHVAFAPLEPKFIKNFARAVGKKGRFLSETHRKGLRRLFRSKTREAWTRLQNRYDFCLSPVLTVEEACGWPRTGRLPRMGRDNRRILRSLGYSKRVIQGWEATGVL